MLTARRGVLCALFAIASCFIGASCSREPARPEVVLYTSSDDFLARPIVERFEKETGIRVRMAGDTEATKTTGLVERLLAEKDKPRADVWWSNEMLGTATLAQRGLFEPFTPACAADFREGWPAAHMDPYGLWYGTAPRARIIAFNTNRITPAQAPTRLRDLTDPKYKGLVGMARPLFGTTRSQMAAIAAAAGEAALRDWLIAMKANGLRLFDGNSAVVRALAHGEIEVGLTDTDDALALMSSGQPINFVFEAADPPGEKPEGLPSVGPLLIPNTVALLKGRPNKAEGERLADFLLSAAVEEALAKSDSRNWPIRPSLRDASGLPPMPAGAPVTPRQLLEARDIADRVVREVLGSS